MTGPQGLEQVFDLEPTQFIGVFNQLLYSGNAAMAARLAWFIGKMGKPLLPECRRVILAPDSAGTWLLGLLGIMAIGLRHGKLKPQVLKALKAAFKAAKNHPNEVLRLIVEAGSEKQNFLYNVFGAVSEPDMTFKIYLEYCKKGFIEAFEHAPLPEQYRWKVAGEVPDDLALALGANLYLGFHEEPHDLVHLVLMLPWIARCEAEDFYFPQDFHKHVYVPWRPELAIEMIECEREAWGEVKTIKVEKTPGRNDPCPCGSKKKYKKCCLREKAPDVG
jgi:hypothetical protein